MVRHQIAVPLRNCLLTHYGPYGAIANFQMFEHYRKTDRQTDQTENITTSYSRVIIILFSIVFLSSDNYISSMLRVTQ